MNWTTNLINIHSIQHFPLYISEPKQITREAHNPRRSKVIRRTSCYQRLSQAGHCSLPATGVVDHQLVTYRSQTEEVVEFTEAKNIKIVNNVAEIIYATGPGDLCRWEKVAVHKWISSVEFLTEVGGFLLKNKIRNVCACSSCVYRNLSRPGITDKEWRYCESKGQLIRDPRSSRRMWYMRPYRQFKDQWLCYIIDRKCTWIMNERKCNHSELLPIQMMSHFV